MRTVITRDCAKRCGMKVHTLVRHKAEIVNPRVCVFCKEERRGKARYGALQKRISGRS